MKNSEIDNAHVLIQKGVAAAQVGRHLDALKYHQQALKIEPENYDAACSVANAYACLNENQKALETAKMATGLAPEEDWAYRIQAFVLLHLGRLREAHRLAQQAARIDPEGIYCLYILARIALKRSRYGEADWLANRIIQLYPQEVSGYLVKGLINYQKKKYKDAEYFYQEALKLDPEHRLALDGMADVKQKLDELHASRGLFGQLLSQNPNSEATRLRLQSVLVTHILQGSFKDRYRSMGAKLVYIFLIWVALGLIGYFYYAEQLHTDYAVIVSLAYFCGLPLCIMTAFPFFFKQYLKTVSEAHRKGFVRILIDNYKSKIIITFSILTSWLILGFIFVMPAASKTEPYWEPLIFTFFPFLIAAALFWMYIIALLFLMLLLPIIDICKVLAHRITNKPQGRSLARWLMITLSFLSVPIPYVLNRIYPLNISALMAFFPIVLVLYLLCKHRNFFGSLAFLLGTLSIIGYQWLLPQVNVDVLYPIFGWILFFGAGIALYTGMSRLRVRVEIARVQRLLQE